MNVLDCTLRDGGYHNKWDFDSSLVQKYMNSIQYSCIDIIEVGFRFPPKKDFLGPFAHASDDIINSIDLPDCDIAVMINAKDFINKESIKDYFQDSYYSPVDVVRIATNSVNIDYAIYIASELKELKYKVAINIMQASSIDDETLSLIGKKVEECRSADILYLADSFGAMSPERVFDAYHVLQENWTGQCGFHGHNNKGQALANTLKAMHSGATWLDGTLLGMGRGAGNTETEYLLIELAKFGFSYKSSELWKTSLEDFSPLKKQYGWGPSLLYYLSAEYGVHPTYVQELIDSGIDSISICDSLEYLKKSNGNSYNPDNLIRSKSGTMQHGSGTWDVSGWAKDKDVIIVAPGKEGKKHAKQVNDYAKRNNAFVIGLNATSNMFSVDAYAICHAIRLSTEIPNICKSGIPVLSPISLLSEEVQKRFEGCKVLDYGITIKDGLFEPGAFQCTIPSLLVAPYAIGAAIAGGADRVMLVGFDGYSKNDPRHSEMENVLSICCHSNVPIFTVTPTSYESVPKHSIYCVPWKGKQ